MLNLVGAKKKLLEWLFAGNNNQLSQTSLMLNCTDDTPL